MKLKTVRGIYVLPVVGSMLLFFGFQNCTKTGILAPATETEMASTGIFSKISESEKVSLEGSIGAVYEDYPDGTHKIRHYLKEKSGKVYEIKTEHGLAVSAMSHVKVKGRIKKNQDSADTLEVAAEDAAVFMYNQMPTDNPFVQTYPNVGLAPYSIGEQKTLILLINFVDNPIQEITLEEGQQWFKSLDAYIREGSKGKTWLTGEVRGWYTLNLNSADCNSASSFNIGSAARSQATQEGVVLSSFDRIIFAHTQTACSHAGVGEAGGTPTTAYINGQLKKTGTLFHEFGHNLGLNHSPSMYCKTGGPLGSTCVSMEYGDILDVMGKSGCETGPYSPMNKMYMGWLDSQDVTEVTTDGVYNLAPYSDTGTKAKVLRIAKPGDPGYWFHINMYQPIGFDAPMLSNLQASHAFSYENLTKGVVVRETSGIRRSLLLDMTPDSMTGVVSDDYDPALTVGSSYQDPYSGIKLTTESVSASGASVRVEFTGQRSCRPRAPYLQYPVIQNVSYNASGMPGVATEVSITLGSPSSLDCGNESMTIASVLPEGWSVNLGAMPVIVQAGSLTTYKVAIIPPATAAYQNYDLKFSVTNAQGLSSDSILRFNVTSTPPVNKAPVAVNDNVSITTKAAVKVNVLANDSDPEGKPLSVVAVSRPGSGSAVINSDGTITYTPSNRFKSTDSFSYTISDGNSTRSAYVYITLSGGNTTGGGKR